MRLIYADALKEVFKEKSSEAVCGVELCKAIISQIDSQPTVDAIPVEWIKQYVEANWYDFGTQYNAITKMLEEWERKEE